MQRRDIIDDDEGAALPLLRPVAYMETSQVKYTFERRIGRT